MDEREFEKGFANFHRKLNHVLRERDVKSFKRHVAAHPVQAGKLTHCLGLSDEFAEIEMYKAILIRPALSDLHQEAGEWLMKKGIDPPVSRAPKRARRGKRGPERRGKQGQ